MGRRGAKAGRKRAAAGMSARRAAAPQHVRAWRPQAGPPVHIIERQQAHLARLAERRRLAPEVGLTGVVAPVAAPPSVAARARPAVPPRRPPTSVPLVARRPAALPAPVTRAAVGGVAARRWRRPERVAAVLLMVPTLAVASVLSFAVLRHDVPALQPSVAPRDLAIALPAGEIRFSDLRLPATPPRITAIRPRQRRELALPAPSFVLVPDLPAELIAPVIDPRLAALPSPQVAPEIAAVSPAPALALPQTPTQTPTQAPAQCVAAPGFSLARPTGSVPLPPFDPEAHADREAFGLKLAAAAKAQTEQLVVYDARYTRIAYPGGDVSPFYGVCTDVVVRAYRALGIDLQQAITEARVGTGDRSIDHRRTEVVRKFLARAGESLPISEYAEDYRPGDIITYYRPQNKISTAHIAIVSDVIAPSGRPMIIHNRGWGVQLEDALFVDKMTGHYRYAGPMPAPGRLVASSRSPATRALSEPRADAVKAAAKTVAAKPRLSSADSLPARPTP